MSIVRENCITYIPLRDPNTPSVRKTYAHTDVSLLWSYAWASRMTKEGDTSFFFFGCPHFRNICQCMKIIHSLWYGIKRERVFIEAIIQITEVACRFPTEAVWIWFLVDPVHCHPDPPSRLKDLLPWCWIIELRCLSSQLIVLEWAVTFLQKTCSCMRHDWLTWESKGPASLPYHGTSQMGQYSFKVPLSQLKCCCDCSMAQFQLHSFPWFSISTHILFPIALIS